MYVYVFIKVLRYKYEIFPLIMFLLLNIASSVYYFITLYLNINF